MQTVIIAYHNHYLQPSIFSHFVQIQAGEVMPFIEEILNNITSIICDLQPHQYHTFYEAVGLMIQSQSDHLTQEHLIKRYMDLPNQTFNQYIQGNVVYINIILQMAPTNSRSNKLT